MKKMFILAATILLAVSPGFAQKANIANTPHDMTVTAGGSGCTVCHAPHNSASALKAVLLWNPTAASGTFATYTGSQINTTPTALAVPTVATDASTGSYMCLSCHDGTTATANFGVAGPLNGAAWNIAAFLSDGTTAPAQPNATNGTLVTQAAGDTDLTNDHPVNFTFPDPIPVGVTGYDTLANIKLAGFKFYGATTDSVQCGTCHDPHDQNLAGPKFYLRTAQTTTTAFCTQCHL